MAPAKVALLVPPQGDKNWSFQMVNITEDDADTVRRAFLEPDVKRAEPFLQGLSRDWIMVEFWVADKAIIDAAAKVLFDRVKQPWASRGFTRADLGLG